MQHAALKFRSAFRRLPLALACLGLSASALAEADKPAAATPAEAYVVETADNLPGYNIYRPADLAERSVPVPVIVWANGACVRFDTIWSGLAKRWAGAGFVVITMNDPEAAAKMMAAREQMEKDAAAGRAEPPRDASGAPGGAPPPDVVAMQTAATADAQAKAIDWAIAETAAEGSPYAGKLDTARIAAAGNSCGGISSLTLASRDKRPRALFILSGSSVGPNATREQAAPVMGKVTVPTLWVVGGEEDIARAAANLDYSLLPPGTPGAVVYRASGDHRTVSTTPAILNDAAEIGLAWFRATLLGDQDAGALLTSKVCPDCDAATWTIKAKDAGGLR